MQKESRAPRPTGKGFVGSEACQKCHVEAFESFHHHPMATSLDEVELATPIEEFRDATFSFSGGLSYYVDRTPEGVFHHEKRVDAAGDLIYDQGVKVAFAVGSGTRGRSYLINESGRLFASPISWFTGIQKWALSPGYDPESNLRFDRRVSDGCVSCHAGRTEMHGKDLNRFAERPFPERSIGCERCHGPGADHIDFRSSAVTASAVDPIFNPVRVNDARRDAVCNQCHLTARRRVVLAGRTEFDFQAGMNLSDNWVIFLKSSMGKSGESKAVSQVEQMYSSVCYQKSGVMLGCINCHSGHEPPGESSAGDFYRKKCLACHSNGKTECSEPVARRQLTTADDSCIACHMPRFPASDVHATQTDHRIRRHYDDPAAESPLHERPRDTRPVIFQEPGVRILRADRDRAKGIVLGEQARGGSGAAQAREAIDLLLSVVKRDPGDIEARFVLGNALEAIGKSELAIRAWEETLKLQPTHEEALESLASLNHQNGNLESARNYYERLIAVNPQRPNYYGRFAHVLGQLDELPRGIEYAEKCLSMNPSLFQTHSWLVEAYRRSGNEELAARHEATLKQFESVRKRGEPDSSPPAGK